jgi:hypothetical protein
MIGPRGDIESLSIEEFEDIWRLNTGSSFLVCDICSIPLILKALMVVVDATMPPKYGRQQLWKDRFQF